MQVLLFLARSSTQDVPLLVGIVTDGRDRRDSEEFISVQSNGTIFAGPNNHSVLFTVDVTGRYLKRRCSYLKEVVGIAVALKEHLSPTPSPDGAWHMLTVTTEVTNGSQTDAPGYSLYLDGGFVGNAASVAERYGDTSRVSNRVCLTG